MEKKGLIVAVDGHSSTGKSTVSKILAARLGYTYIDTGAMYRIVTLKAMREGLIKDGNVDDEKLKEVLPTIIFGFKYNEGKKCYESYMNGEYVETAIRGLEVSDNVSLIAALPYVRELLVEKQREMAKEGGVIMDGRDIGSVVFPHAEVKFFMTASPEVRAQRLQGVDREGGKSDLRRGGSECPETGLYRRAPGNKPFGEDAGCRVD